MAGRFVGQAAIVTAGGSGIGAATARRLADEGAGVVVADLSGTRAEVVTASITASGGRAAAIKMDASDPQAVQRTLRVALDAFGRVDIMVNNAGLAEPALLDQISLESWNRVIAVTLTSVFLGMKFCLPLMRASVQRPRSLKPNSSNSSFPRSSCSPAGSGFTSRNRPASQTIDGPAP